jgi:adenosylcobinamide kinase / adenosylcobinamide-phosphate guanylyltransferase
MGKMILVTGGARSGKSTFAEEMVKKLGDKVLYIATAIPFDDEMKLRIKKHKDQRPSSWETLEVYKNFDMELNVRLKSKSVVLLDCITVMITNLMFEKCQDWDHIKAQDMENIEKYVQIELEKLLQVIDRAEATWVLVTNEVGMGLVPEYPFGRAFRDVAGRMNQMLATVSSEVYFCVSGIPMKIK